jgi:hypothetical protein
LLAILLRHNCGMRDWLGSALLLGLLVAPGPYPGRGEDDLRVAAAALHVGRFGPNKPDAHFVSDIEAVAITVQGGGSGGATARTLHGHGAPSRPCMRLALMTVVSSAHTPGGHGPSLAHALASSLARITQERGADPMRGCDPTTTTTALRLDSALLVVAIDKAAAAACAQMGQADGLQQRCVRVRARGRGACPAALLFHTHTRPCPSVCVPRPEVPCRPAHGAAGRRSTHAHARTHARTHTRTHTQTHHSVFSVGGSVFSYTHTHTHTRTQVPCRPAHGAAGRRSTHAGCRHPPRSAREGALHPQRAVTRVRAPPPRVPRRNHVRLTFLGRRMGPPWGRYGTGHC